MTTPPNIWMLNLKFSTDTNSLNAGRFDPAPTIPPPPPPPRPYFSYSQVWLKYNKPTSPTLPSWVKTELSPVDNSNIVEADWDWCGISDVTLQAQPGDFMVARLAPSFDPNGGSLRCAMVFGRGRQGPLPKHPNSRQSPLSDSGYFPLALVDTAPPILTSWPPKSGVGVPWIWCVGKFYDDPNADSDGAHYSFNIGANYRAAGASSYLTYGHDPTVVVKGGGHRP